MRIIRACRHPVITFFIGPAMLSIFIFLFTVIIFRRFKSILCCWSTWVIRVISPRLLSRGITTISWTATAAAIFTLTRFTFRYSFIYVTSRNNPNSSY